MSERGWWYPVLASTAVRAVVLVVAVGAVATAVTVGAPPAQVAPTAARTPAVTAPTEPSAPGAVAAVPVQGWAGATPMAASVPVRLQIPAIGVDTDLIELGLTTDGAMEVPPEGFPAGWYGGAPTPGELGPAIIAGHVDWDGPGVFHDLHTLAPDDEVIVTRADGTVATFRVTTVGQYPKSAFPTDEVYGDIDHAGLRLITCGGDFNRAVGHHDDNVVVFAELV